MAKKRAAGADVLNELQQKSSDYARWATTLSNLLAQAEAFFEDMPGKVETSVDRPPFRLSLERMGKSWGLYITEWEGGNDTSDMVRVATAPIRLKSQAAQMLPDLYNELIRHFDNSHDMLIKGLESLRSLPFLDFEVAEKGALAEDDYFPEGGFPNDEIPF